MIIRNLFDRSELDETIERLNNLKPGTIPKWGKMKVAQMLAHINVSYEMDHEDIHKKPGAFARFMIKLLAKNAVVGPKPYPKNGRTAPQFIITTEKDFEVEKKRLIEYLEKTHAIGASQYDYRESNSFGKLTTDEWNTLYSKHIDHHFTQFGV